MSSLVRRRATRSFLPEIVACLAAALFGCGAPAKQELPKEPKAAARKPLDESRRFPLADQVSMQLVNDKLLGKGFLPGGNVAEYRRRGKTYTQFLVHAASPESAALLLFDYKNVLHNAKYLAHMGGYFGYDGGQPVYVFPKNAFLAGFVGLPEKDADVLARQFAARLN